jgi:hypothetical protein
VIDDIEAVGARVPMLMPTTYNVYNDMCIDVSARAFFLTNNATLLHGSMSGVIFDCFASEGFWIYHGRGTRARIKFSALSSEPRRTAMRSPRRRCATTSCIPARTRKARFCACVLEMWRKNLPTLPCPDNGKSAPGSDAIADCTCDPGFYRSGDLCVICPLDSYCPRGVFQPVACPAPGRTFYEGSAVRLDCHCPRRHFRDPPADEERFNCSLCTPDDYCFNNSLYNCSDALMESAPGSGFFDNCTCVNLDYNNGTRCEDCNVDFSCVGGRQHACPALEWTNGLTRKEACVCRPGFVRAGANAECVPCTDDFFCDGSDDRQHPCPPSSLGRGATNVSECLCNVTFQVVHSNNVSQPHSCRECSQNHSQKNSSSNISSL